MKPFRYCALLFLFHLAAVQDSKVVRHQFGAVTVSAVDSFGRPRADCKVAEFRSMDDEEVDYVDRFDGLTGHDIPVGHSYRIHLRCADAESAGPFFALVNRQDAFLVLGAWLNRGDYETGSTPRLTVNVDQARSQISSEAWVKIIGIYTSVSEADRIDSQTHSARFYDPQPGRYLLLLLDGEKVVCTKQIAIEAPKAQLRLVLPSPCRIDALSSVTALD